MYCKALCISCTQVSSRSTHRCIHVSCNCTKLHVMWIKHWRRHRCIRDIGTSQVPLLSRAINHAQHCKYQPWIVNNRQRTTMAVMFWSQQATADKSSRRGALSHHARARGLRESSRQGQRRRRPGHGGRAPARAQEKSAPYILALHSISLCSAVYTSAVL